MNLKNLPPVLVPAEHRVEVERMTKAALMDLVWDFCERERGAEDVSSTLAVFRANRDVIEIHREKCRMAALDEQVAQ